MESSEPNLPRMVGKVSQGLENLQNLWLGY